MKGIFLTLLILVLLWAMTSTAFAATEAPMSLIDRAREGKLGEDPYEGLRMAKVTGTETYANIRFGPGTDYEVMGYVYPGEVIGVGEKSKDDYHWYEVLYGDGMRAGWLHRNFIQFTD